MPTYIDPTGSNGTGTKLNPYNSFTEVNTYGGDMQRQTILLKAGTTIKGIFKPATPAYNFTLGAYGTGAQPIIDASAAYGAGWTLNSGTTWQRTVTGNQNRDNLVFVAGEILQRVTALATCQATPNSTYWTSGTVYVNLSGTDPNTVDVFYTNEEASVRTSAALANGVDGNIFIDGIEGRYGNLAGFYLDGVGDNLVIQDCINSYSGAMSSSGRTSFLLYGTGPTALANDWIIRRNKASYITNTGVEFQFVNNMLFEDNEFDMCGMGIELWGYVQNSRFLRNKAINSVVTASGGRGRGFWATGSAQSTNTGRNSNNTVEGNIFAGNRSGEIEINSGSGWKIRNNVLVSTLNQVENGGMEACEWNKNGVDATDNIAIEFSNNIVVLNHLTRNFLVRMGATAAAAHALTGGNNHYFTSNRQYLAGDFQPMHTQYNNTTYFSASTYLAAANADNYDLNSIVTLVSGDGDPGFTDPGSFESRRTIDGLLPNNIKDIDYRPLADYIGIGKGRSLTPTTTPPTAGKDGKPFKFVPSIGAYEA